MTDGEGESVEPADAPESADASDPMTMLLRQAEEQGDARDPFEAYHDARFKARLLGSVPWLVAAFAIAGIMLGATVAAPRVQAVVLPPCSTVTATPRPTPTATGRPTPAPLPTTTSRPTTRPTWTPTPTPTARETGAPVPTIFVEEPRCDPRLPPVTVTPQSRPTPSGTPGPTGTSRPSGSATPTPSPSR